MFKKNASFKSISSLQNRVLSQLQHKINAQQQLTQHVKSLLPESLAKQVLHCVLKDNTLILYTPAAIWASQLRFYSQVIIGGAQERHTTTLLIKVIQKPNLPDTIKRKANIPSPEKIEFLKSYSDTVQDNQLQASLLKLSNTLTRLSSRNQ